jgi:hypothetical protein
MLIIFLMHPFAHNITPEMVRYQRYLSLSKKYYEQKCLDLPESKI